MMMNSLEFCLITAWPCNINLHMIECEKNKYFWEITHQVTILQDVTNQYFRQVSSQLSEFDLSR